MALPEIRDILFTADGITDKPIATDDEIAALREENEQLQKQVKVLLADKFRLQATKAVHDELSELLNLYMIDGTIHDLDRYPPDQMPSVLASVLSELMHRLKKAEAAIHETVNANNHLADGEQCTLQRLVQHIKEFPGQA